MLTQYLREKLMSDSTDLQNEGAHALWEMSVNKDHHDDILPDCVAALLKCLGSSDLEARIRFQYNFFLVKSVRTKISC